MIPNSLGWPISEEWISVAKRSQFKMPLTSYSPNSTRDLSYNFNLLIYTCTRLDINFIYLFFFSRKNVFKL